MADAGLALVALLVLGGAVVALRAVLDGLRTGLPASIAVLAPLAEGARLLRTRRASGGALAGSLFLLAAVLRVLVSGLAGPVGVAGFVIADAVWWLGGLLLVERRPRFMLGALAVELPLLLALAAPVVAARSLRIDVVVAADRAIPLAVEAPVAFLIVLAVGGVLLPWAVSGGSRPVAGRARLLVGAGLAAQPVSAAAAASVLFLGLGGWSAVGAEALLTVVLVVAARRFPALRLRRLIGPALALLTPLAVLQLAIVIALTLYPL